MRLLRTAIFVLFSALVAGTAFGMPPYVEWIRQHDGPAGGYDEATAIIVDIAGNALVTGLSQGAGSGLDYLTLMYSPTGGLEWATTYSGPGGGSDMASAIRIDASGNVLVTGSSLGNETLLDYATVRYDTGGELLWAKRFASDTGSIDEACGLEIDASGSIYVSGTSEGDFATLKYDSTGTLLWTRLYTGVIPHGLDVARAVSFDTAGFAVVTGASDDTTGLSWTAFATVRYDTAGNEMWVRRYGSPGSHGNVPSALTVDGDGNILVVGWSDSDLSDLTDYEVLTIKYSPTGELLWAREYSSPGGYDDEAYDVAVDDLGNVYIAGSTWDKCLTVKYDADGSFLWAMEYPQGSEGFAMTLDSAGCPYVVGTGAFVVKYNPDGSMAWDRSLQGGGVFNAVTVTLSGDIYVTGGAPGVSSPEDITTVKYSQTCRCPYQSDIDTTGFVDSVDLAEEVDVVFFGSPDPQDLGCPVARGDFNANGFSDSVDLSLLIDHVFFGGGGPTDPCIP